MVKLGVGNSRSRKKINYNSFYNADLRRNRRTYNINRTQSVVPISFAGAAQTLSSSTSRTSSISSPIQPAIGPTLGIEEQKYYVIEETTNIELDAQSYEEVINEAEDGEIIAVEAVTNSPDITIEIVIYGLGNSPNIINNYSIKEMVRRGRGLTPGEVEDLPGGRSKDPSGIPRHYYPYIARYKVDELVDYLGDSRQYYTFVYEPGIPMPYTSLIINAKNTSTTSDLLVDSINVHRKVLGSPLLDNLAGKPIESSEVFKLPSAEEEIPAATIVPSTPTESPYIANYLKRQQEEKEKRNAPEEIPSEDVMY